MDTFQYIQENALMISEFPMGATPSPHNFPKRNRIVAGLSVATLVVEASHKSGSLITAKLAHQYGRKVFAIPGSPLDKRYDGCNSLIKNNMAELAQNPTDVLNKVRNLQMSDNEKEYFNIPQKLPDENDMRKYRSTVLDQISHTPTDIEDIVKALSIPYSIVNLSLIELELAGKIERIYGNKVYLID